MKTPRKRRTDSGFSFPGHTRSRIWGRGQASPWEAENHQGPGTYTGTDGVGGNGLPGISCAKITRLRPALGSRSKQNAAVPGQARLQRVMARATPSSGPGQDRPRTWRAREVCGAGVLVAPALSASASWPPARSPVPLARRCGAGTRVSPQAPATPFSAQASGS